MTPYDILLKHEDLVTLVIDHGYIPHKSQANFRQVVDALKQINPKAKYDLNCSGCITEIVRMARVHIQAHKAKMTINKRGLEPVFHTFPKQEKKRGKK